MKNIYVGKRSAIEHFAEGKFLIGPFSPGNYLLTDGVITNGFETEVELRRAIYEIRKAYPEIKVHWLLPPGVEGFFTFVGVATRYLFSIPSLVALLVLVFLVTKLWHWFAGR